MFSLNKQDKTISLNFNLKLLNSLKQFVKNNILNLIFFVLVFISVFSFLNYLGNGLGLSYNDARSHLDIGRRVVEGLKPGFAQIGSVWLPLPHMLMVLTIWNDFMWHSGLAGALQSMISFIATALIIFYFLKELGVNVLGRVVGICVFILNLNILYLQSTAMTELLLIATMTAGCYQLLIWFKKDNMLSLVKAAFFIMLSTLIRYDGWFLFVFSSLLIGLWTLRKKGYKASEAIVILFATLAGIGIVAWVIWNTLIFKDPLYFIFGPYSAFAQQEQLSKAGVLITKGDLLTSLKVYFYGVAYNSNTFVFFLGVLGSIIFWLDKKNSGAVKVAAAVLYAPFIFNVLALYLGQSVLFIQGLSGNTWFNARYGILMMPSFAIFIGYLINRVYKLKYVFIGLLAFVLFFSFINGDAVTIDDATVGSSQKNVAEVSGWLSVNAKDKPGFVLISAASHDAIIFSSGLPMSKFIHEGTGAYWDNATVSPDRWARWIVMRTNDVNDLTFKLVSQSKAFKLGYYKLVDHYPFADIYEIKPEYVKNLNTKPILGKQK